MNKQIEEMDLVVLNCYRNKYYSDGINTEQGVVADAINKVLPILVSLKNAGYRKQIEGEWGFDGMNWTCSECGEYAPVDKYGQIRHTDYCPNCGAKMKGGAE